jgi:diguanylate cyclase (GGDEF)-like protein
MQQVKSGMLYWVDTVITPQLGEHGKPIAYMAIRIDITARKHAEAQISYAATHDALTGLANRAALLERMSEALAHMQLHGGALTALMVDLDGFKNVNDTLGHAAGDTLLKELAGRFESSLGDTDMIARLGGDEFAVIQADVADQREDAIELAVRLLELAARPFHLDGQDVCIGTSIGIALAPANGADAGELLKKADLALYRVKSEGRNSFSFFDEDLNEKAISRLQLSTTCGRRCCATNSSCTTSRCSIPRRRGPAEWKRWSGGDTRSRDCCIRIASSALPKRPD